MVKIWDWNPLRQLSVLKGLLSNLTVWDPLSIVHQRRFLNLTNVFGAGNFGLLPRIGCAGAGSLWRHSRRDWETAYADKDD